MTIEETEREIARTTRLASGNLVKDVIARKRTWSLSWKYLAGDTANTMDGGLGRDALKTLFETGGELNFILPEEGGGSETVEVMFGEEFGESLITTSPDWKWKVSFELIEV
jgi:hypothetical protein